MLREAILTYIAAAGRDVKRAELVEEFGHLYFCNGDKYIGDILSRLVNSRLLVRTSPGYYKTPDRYPQGTKKPAAPPDSNQTSLW